MNLANIKEIIARIKKDTGLQIVKGNTTAPQPSLPYGVYNVTAPYVKDRTKGVSSRFSDDTGTYEKRVKEYKFTISFSFFAEDVETTIGLAHRIHEWFSFVGIQFIQDRNLVIVSIESIQDRTTFLVDHYDYKHGFDVHFRAIDEQIRSTETIETVILGG